MVLAKTVLNLWVPQIFGKFLNNCKTDSFSRRAQHHEYMKYSLLNANHRKLLLKNSSIPVSYTCVCIYVCVCFNIFHQYQAIVYVFITY
jgi:hypothetical protein